MSLEHKVRRLRFRAWHRGTKEADLMVGGFFDRYAEAWTEEEIDWFERFLEVDDVHIMAWALGTQPVPPEWRGPMMDAFRRLDFVPIAH